MGSSTREIRVIFASLFLLAILYCFNHGIGSSKSPKESVMEYLESNTEYLPASILTDMPVGTDYFPDNFHSADQYPATTDLSQYFKPIDEVDRPQQLEPDTLLGGWEGSGSESVINGGNFMQGVTGAPTSNTQAGAAAPL